MGITEAGRKNSREMTNMEKFCESKQAAVQEMKIAHMSTIAGRLNVEFILNCREYYESAQNGNYSGLDRSRDLPMKILLRPAKTFLPCF
jgi:hypothetical protein